MLKPIHILASPTAGKIVLCALLEGHEEIFSTPLWHDNVSSALCDKNAYLPTINKDYLIRLYGHDQRMKFFRKFIYNYTDYYKLEYLTRLGYYSFYLSADKILHIPYKFDFYNFDKSLANMICSMEEYTPENIFSAIFSCLCMQIHGESTRKYAVTMPWNNFNDYEKLIKTFPESKMIYISRDDISSIGSAMLRANKLGAGNFYELCIKIFGNTDFIFDLIQRGKYITDLCAKYPDRILIVDFKSLIIDTNITMKKVSEFLDIEYHDILCQPTFAGKIIDDNIVGKIQDNYNSFTTQQLSLLSEYLEYYKNYNKCKELTIAPTMFSTNLERNENGSIILNNIRNLMCFCGPFLPVPVGKFKIIFFFSDGIGEVFSIDALDKERNFIFKNKKISINSSKQISLFLQNTKPNTYIYFKFFKASQLSCKFLFTGCKISFICDDTFNLSKFQNKNYLLKLKYKLKKLTRFNRCEI